MGSGRGCRPIEANARALFSARMHVLPNKEQRANVCLKDQACNSVNDRLPTLMFHRGPTENETDGGAKVLYAQVIPVHATLRSHLQQPRPIIRAFFKSRESCKRQYNGHRKACRLDDH